MPLLKQFRSPLSWVSLQGGIKIQWMLLPCSRKGRLVRHYFIFHILHNSSCLLDLALCTFVSFPEAKMTVKSKDFESVQDINAFMTVQVKIQRTARIRASERCKNDGITCLKWWESILRGITEIYFLLKCIFKILTFTVFFDYPVYIPFLVHMDEWNVNVQ